VGYIPFTRVYQNEQIFTSGNPGQPGEAVNSFGDIDLAVEVQIFKRPKGTGNFINLRGSVGE